MKTAYYYCPSPLHSVVGELAQATVAEQVCLVDRYNHDTTVAAETYGKIVVTQSILADWAILSASSNRNTRFLRLHEDSSLDHAIRLDMFRIVVEYNIGYKV
jgi:hypothetical protein